MTTPAEIEAKFWKALKSDRTFMLGLKDASFLRYHEARPGAHADLLEALNAPSLYDDALGQLVRAGLLSAEALPRDLAAPYQPSAAVEDA